MEIKSSEKIYSIENLRGIAALMVMFCHIGLLNHYLNLSFSVNFQLGVQLFFAISGFIIPYSMYKSKYEIKHFGRFILRRICRIEPPYLISILLIILVLSLFSNGKVNFSWVDVLLHFGYLIPFFEKSQWINHVYWTLAIEFQFYIFVGLFYPLIFNFNKYISLLFCFSILFLNYLNFSSIKDGEMIYHHFQHFSIGVFTFLFFSNRLNKTEYIFGLILYFVLGKFLMSYTHAGISFISSILIIFLNKKTSFGDFFGSISYSLYITHSITLIIFSYFFGYLFSSVNLILNVFLLTLVSLLCIIIAYIFYLLFEKPFLNYSKQISYH